MTDFAVQRNNMVESQVRTYDVTDRRVLRAMQEVPRERFVPEASQALAYMGEPVTLAPGRVLLAPALAARLLQLADVAPVDSVLVVGCGAGYMAALAAGLARVVTALECDASLAAAAKGNVAALGLDNVDVATGPLEKGCPALAPYDLILVEGAIEELPAALTDQLRNNGRLVAVLSDGPVGRAVLIERLGKVVSQRTVFDATTPVLPGFERKPIFAL